MSDTDLKENLPDGVVGEVPNIDPGEDLEPVEVELEADAESGEDDGSEGVEDKPKREPKAKKRIAKLTAEREQYREAAERESQRREEAERRAAEADAARYRADYMAVSYSVKALKTDLDAARREHQDAIDKADSKAQTDAQVRISELTSQIGEAQRWLAANPKPEEYKPAAPAAKAEPEQQRQPAQRAEPEVAPSVKAWIRENSWFDPKSEDYDPELRQEASDYATLLEKRLIRQGRRDEIGSKAYFAEIDKHMRAEFPDVFGDEDDEDDEPAQAATRKPLAMRAGGSPVAPATRGAAPGTAPAARTSNPARVVLSAEERQMAEAMGGVLKKPGGGLYTPQELHVIYARNKLKQQRTNAR